MASDFSLRPLRLSGNRTKELHPERQSTQRKPKPQTLPSVLLCGSLGPLCEKVLSKSAQVIFHETGSSETRLDALRIKLVPDEIWNEAARHYDEQALAGLLLAISTINVWNRLNVATRQVAGEWMKSAEAREWVKKGAEELSATHA